MLLDIQEPQQKSSKQSKRKEAVGIDLGTTKSLVAYKKEFVQIAKNKNGKNYIDSAVKFSHGTWKVSDSREEGILSFKRFMGKESKDFNSKYEYTQIDHNSLDELKLNHNKSSITPVELSSIILKQLMQSAKENFRKDFTDAVITVPAYFDDAARSATFQAAKLSGINVLRLLNEPTAAALAYGIDNKKKGTYLVYDFGGGTFDVSLLKIAEGVFKVVATNGDTLLGGDDIDNILVDYLLEQLKLEANSYNLSSLKYLSQLTKEKLSSEEIVEINFASQNILITKKQFEALISPIIKKTVKLTSETLKIAKIESKNIDGIILVGGSSRIPLIKKELSKEFQCKILDDIDPDEAVVRGAAIQAHNLTNDTDHLLLDVIPLSLGIEVMGGLNDKIIERNTTIPFSAKKEFTTYADGQTGMKFHIIQGERELAKDCRSLCQFEINGIPPQIAGSIKIEVDFNIDSNGILNISAKDKTNNIFKEVEINPSYGMLDSEINKMLDDSLKYAKEDVTNKLLSESVVHASQLIQYIEKYLREDHELLSKQNFYKISSQLECLKKSISNKNRNEIDKNVELLEKFTANFIQDRMNKYLMRDLEGKEISLVEKYLETKKI